MYNKFNLIENPLHKATGTKGWNMCAVNNTQNVVDTKAVLAANLHNSLIFILQ